MTRNTNEASGEQWQGKNMTKLQKQYAGKVVRIGAKGVTDSADSYPELFNKIAAKEGFIALEIAPLAAGEGKKGGPTDPRLAWFRENLDLLLQSSAGKYVAVGQEGPRAVSNSYPALFFDMAEEQGMSIVNVPSQPKTRIK